MILSENTFNFFIMDLKGILSISGHSGLFKLVSQARNGIIVESLDTKKRMPAYATSKISALEDIAIYTESDDIQLKEVFKAIFKKEDGKQAISHKSDASELKKYFAEILPDYDRDRVYVSDIKRVLSWYNILQKHQLVDLDEEQQEKPNPETDEESKKTTDKE